MKRGAHGTLSRFGHYDVDPSKVRALSIDHPAVVDGHTLFPTTVVGTFGSPRFLISGMNSSKMGKTVMKGPWSGFPIYGLTLEERATCPRSCAVWSDCYGNAMHRARRNDAFDPDFIPALKAEVLTLVREVCSPVLGKPDFKPPKGILIRLHVLGDFFSVPYVKAWAELLRHLPEVHVYGYTAYKPDDKRPAYAAIGQAVLDLTREFPERFAIRWSGESGPMGSIVVDKPVDDPNVIMCPAQVHKTELCATCALCWSPAAADKTVAFLRHGMKVSRPRADRLPAPLNPRAAVSKGLTVAEERLLQAMRDLADDRGVLMLAMDKIARQAAMALAPAYSMTSVLVAKRYVQRLHEGRGRAHPTVWRVFAGPQTEFPPPPTISLPARKPNTYIPVRDPPPPTRSAKPAAERKPDEPLVRKKPYVVKAKYHGRTGALLNPHAIGSAADFDIGSAEDRIARLDAEAKARIEAMYGATFKKKDPA
jgi:hypothetical protein